MTLTSSTVGTNNIASLVPLPNDEGGLTATDFQYLFDKFGVDFTAFFNDVHLVELVTQLATKAELAGVVLGDVVDGSLTDVKLSNVAGQIKERVATLSGNFTTHDNNEVVHAPDALGTAGQALIVNSGATATEWATVADGAWEKIAEQTLASAVAQVDFASIPSGFTKFQLRITASSADALYPEIAMTFNDDTASNYSYVSAQFNASHVVSVATSAAYLMCGSSENNTLPNDMVCCIIEIDNSNLNKYKHIVVENHREGIGFRFSGTWKNITQLINKISISTAGGQYAIGSKFTLWGCK